MNNLAPINTAANFLVANRKIVTPDLQGYIENDQVRLLDSIFFIRKNITGASSLFPLVDATTEKVDGVSTFKGKSTLKNEALMFNAIAIALAVENGEGKEGSANYTDTDIAALRNASLVIVQGTREVLNLPVADLIRPAGTDMNSSDQYFELGGYALIADDEDFEARLIFPKSTTMPDVPNAGDQYYFEVMFKGYKTIRNVF